MTPMTRRVLEDDDAFDEHGLLKDGHRFTVPMMACDSVQRERDAGHGNVAIRHSGDGARPGFITLADTSMYDAAELARAEAIRDMCDAWRQPSEKAKPSQSSDDDDYYPKIDDVRRPVLDAAEAERIRIEARDAYIRELENAWRR